MEVKVKEKVVAELQKIVGAEHVSTDEVDLYNYSRDMTENNPSWPDFVVMPDTVEEVQEILRLANREKIAVIPYSAGTNVGGLTIPLKGGIVLDMRRMNRIIEMNEEDRYIIVEPGFTFGDLKRFLDKEYPHLWYSIPGAPPSSSVMSNALLDGFGGSCNYLGTNHDGTNGLEVVLPTGEVVKIGSCSVSPYWFNRAPLPDLAGLFFSWQGTTGVVTKIAVQLWPRHPLTLMKQVIITGIQPTCRFLRRMGQTRVCDRCGGMPYDLAQASADQTTWLQQNVDKHPVFSLLEARISTYDRPPGPDKFAINLGVLADTEDELKAKMALMDVIIKEELKDTEYFEHPAVSVDTSKIPPRGEGDYMGGLTWVGTMGPTSQWEKGMERVLPIFDKYRFVRMVALSCFKGAHYGMFRSVIGYNKGDPDEAERANKCIHELLIAALDLGFIPYKASQRAVKEMMRRGDPNWVELLRKVKKMLDPNNIMNPGRFGDMG